MFLHHEDLATVVCPTPLIPADLIVENARGKFLFGECLNCLAQGYRFAPGGRVQKDKPLCTVFERLIDAELGLRLLLSAAESYRVWQHFYDDNFFGEDFLTRHIVPGFRPRVLENDLQLPDIQHGTYRWPATEEILASDHMYDNSQACFCKKSQAGVPGL